MDLLRRKGSQEETGLGKTLATTKLSSPGLTGRSSTPRLLDSIAGVSGMLGRPVKPGDDSSVCFFQRGRPEAGTELAMNERAVPAPYGRSAKRRASFAVDRRAS
jgi:hypothetical protein